MWAMPGFESYIPDQSGEYVFYKDNTFYRESYIGILYYNDSTLQIRYYAPTDVEKALPERDISIYFTLNPESQNLELTGERIDGTLSADTEDVDIINYLHDILYEFTSHRKLIQNLNEREIIIFQDYQQFGGKVAITYDCTIPIFNIRDIKLADGTVLLKCCTTGQLIDGADLSFDNFTGFPQNKYKKGQQSYKKAKSTEYTVANQTITLDKNWNQPMDNFWTLGDDAILSLATAPTISNDKNLSDNYLIRKFIKSTENSYTNFDTLQIKTTENKLEIQVEVYQPITNNTVVNYKIFTENEETKNLDFFVMAVFKQPWLNNKKYFDQIINSYRNN